MSKVTNTLKIFFPGRRYSVDRSYLYYLDKYIDGDSIYLNYDNFRGNKDALPLEDEIKKDFDFAMNLLKNIDFSKYGEIILIAKSVGTVVASKVREMLNLTRARFICLTPLNETIPFLKQTDFIITSRKDKYIDISQIESTSSHFPFMTIYDDLPHSLEYENNLYDTIDLLKTNLDLALNYLDTAYKDLLG